MNANIRRRWKAAVIHALALFGTGLAGASVGGDYDECEEWLGIG
jgi:hypothetical protein